MASKKTTGKGAASVAPVGVPLSLIDGAVGNSLEWLERLPGRIDMFLKIRDESLSDDHRRWLALARLEAGWALEAISQNDSKGAAYASAKAIAAVWWAGVVDKELGIVTVLRRDNARSKGPRKDKGSRRPLLDAWLDKALKTNRSQSAKALWNRLPQDGDLYVSDELVTEPNRTTGKDMKGMSFDGFEKRVTAAKNRRKE